MGKGSNEKPGGSEARLTREHRAQRETGDRKVGWGYIFGSRVQVQDLNFTRHPHLYRNTRARDLRAETWDLRMCDGRS